jgi:23S rRNA (cytidine1920-2'-O)/16S rRNA (cytidine1409-2'-O)-methyltransferase
VTLLERNNARYLEPGALKDVSFVSMDVSFISATLVLPAVLTGNVIREAVVLVKPQFEAGREHIGKGGIVTDPAAHQLAIDRVTASVRSLGAQSTGLIDSPIDGAKGNREFLLHALF